jgi:hypothetical protein
MALTARRLQAVSHATTGAAVESDRTWFVVVAAAMVVLSAVPYVVSAAFGPPDLERVGTFWFIKDFTQYQAAMREGARQSGWLIHDHFSAEPHQAAFIYPLYVGAGKLAATLHLDAQVLFGALEWLGRLSLLGALYLFVATFLTGPTQRRLAVLLAAGTLGMAVLFAPLSREINVFLELNSFGVFLSAPHLMFGLALTLLCGVLYVRRQAVWLALAMLGLNLVHPFNVPVVLSVFVVDAVWSGRRAWLAAALAVCAAAPVLGYNVLLFQTDPFWSGTYGTQNIMLSPAAWALPIDFGLLLLAAPLAWPALRAWPDERRRVLLLWVGLGLLWMYAPLPFQRRFGFGVPPGLAVLAALGILYLSQRFPARLLRYALILAAVSTSLLVYLAVVASAIRNEPSPVYLWTRAEADAGAWLGEHSTASDVVLASTDFSNAVVGTIDGRVVHGHLVATLRSAEKEALVKRFFAADTSPAERSLLLAQSGATYVAVGPRERALGAATLIDQPELARAYDQAGVILFRVQR